MLPATGLTRGASGRTGKTPRRKASPGAGGSGRTGGSPARAGPRPCAVVLRASAALPPPPATPTGRIGDPATVRARETVCNGWVRSGERDIRRPAACVSRRRHRLMSRRWTVPTQRRLHDEDGFE
jgi:hypothetical protein